MFPPQTRVIVSAAPRKDRLQRRTHSFLSPLYFVIFFVFFLISLLFLCCFILTIFVFFSIVCHLQYPSITSLFPILYSGCLFLFILLISLLFPPSFLLYYFHFFLFLMPFNLLLLFQSILLFFVTFAFLSPNTKI